MTTGGDLLPAIRRGTHCAARLGYLPPLASEEAIAALVRPPELGADSAIAGALHLARGELD